MLWLPGKHPDPPEGWSDHVRDARSRVAEWARGRIKKEPGEEIPEDRWSSHKIAFSKVQHRKCGYCEISIAADPSGGDIDHYRPKGAITKLLDDPATWGEEVSDHNSRDRSKPRKTIPACPGKGYHFLAYEWTNYLLACGTCNQKWKGTLFPIKGGHDRAPTPRSVAAETPLLLNPYGDTDPADHLEFSDIGQVTPREDSALGWETIRTCHLTRESLRSQRAPFAQQAWGFIRQLLKVLRASPLREDDLRRALIPLLNLGSPRRAFAGMVRAMWASKNPYGLSWNDLRRLSRKLRPPRP